VHDYIRLNSGVTCAGEYDYDNLRNIMAIMGEISEVTPAERLQAAIDKTGLPEKDVRMSGSIFSMVICFAAVKALPAETGTTMGIICN
jgi:hypothetical protein